MSADPVGTLFVVLGVIDLGLAVFLNEWTLSFLARRVLEAMERDPRLAGLL